VGGSLLLLTCVAAGAGLIWLGARLLGPHPPEGVRAGVFVGFVGLLLVVLLARWASLWIEHWSFDNRDFAPTTGAILTGIVSGLLLAVGLWGFLRPKTQSFVLRLEQGGWFHATTYKGNQGLKVRRGTIVGLLLLIGAGIWTLVSHGTLRRGDSPDWALNIPFTGVVQAQSYGDAESAVAGLPATDKKQVQVRWAGRASLTSLKVKDFLSPAAYRDKVNAVLADPAVGVPSDVQARLKAAESKDIVEFTLAVNQEIDRGLEQLLSSGLMLQDVRTRLRNQDRNTDWADISDLILAVQKETEKAAADLRQKVNRVNEARGAEQGSDETKVREWEKALGEEEKTRWAFALPTASVEVDRYSLRQANDQIKPSERVRVGIKPDPEFPLPEDAVVSTAEFNKAVVALYLKRAQRRLTTSSGKKVLEKLKEATDGAQFASLLSEEISTISDQVLRDRLQTLQGELKLRPGDKEKIIPSTLPLAPATGTTRFAQIPLLPAVQFTVPLLLLVVAIWLAWRVVNMPTFADFLIATEAELNKVSWTTQRRLAQDTVVVLITVLLMAGFLFSMDYFWKTVLSFKPIGVLHIPEDSGKAKQKLEEKKW
jgi:preprotein translocase SecE subunit